MALRLCFQTLDTHTSRHRGRGFSHAILLCTTENGHWKSSQMLCIPHTFHSLKLTAFVILKVLITVVQRLGFLKIPHRTWNGGTAPVSCACRPNAFSYL